MGFKEFIEKQRGIYDKFRDTSAIEQGGLVPRIPNQQGGYFIAFRHPDKIVPIPVGIYPDQFSLKFHPDFYNQVHLY